MKCIRHGVCLVSMVLSSAIAWADYSCSGVLTSSQQEGFKALFSPSYSPSLNIGDPTQPSTWKKVLIQDDLTRLKVDTPSVATTDTLSDQQASDLKGWLNDDASTTIPGWFSTVVTLAVPEAWVGLAADVFVQLVNAAGDNGRMTAANLAGTVTQGGVVGVTEQVANDSSGNLKFLWSYVYQAQINGHQVVSPLNVCSADAVVQ
jgi:hypothetical protein